MFLEIEKNELVDLFSKNLLETNRGCNYYVDWKNVDGYQCFSIEFNAMNALIGCNEFYERFCELLKKMPSVVTTFPYLFALAKADRKKIWKGKTVLKLVGTEIDSADFQEYSFYEMTIKEGLTQAQIDDYYKFFEQMGLKNLFQNLIEKNVIDYIIGVLVGMDSNGRKNRGGKAFELACEPMIANLCEKHHINLITQKKLHELKKSGFYISEDNANRKADFILFDENKKKCMNIEVNFFNGGGSKPEEIIDSYINRQNDLAKNDISFALITDGNCWAGTTNQLLKGFRHLDYLLNYKLAKKGMLDEILQKVFD